MMSPPHCLNVFILWQKILETKYIFFPSIWISTGDGHLMLFRNDHWIPVPGWCIPSSLRPCSYGDELLPIHHQPPPLPLISSVLQMYQPCLHPRTYSVDELAKYTNGLMIWIVKETSSSTWVFLLSDLYIAQSLMSLPLVWLQAIWSLTAPFKVKLCMWSAYNNWLLTGKVFNDGIQVSICECFVIAWWKQQTLVPLLHLLLTDLERHHGRITDPGMANLHQTSLGGLENPEFVASLHSTYNRQALRSYGYCGLNATSGPSDTNCKLLQPLLSKHSFGSLITR